MIPKKIHYVWVGDKQKPELVLKCIASWKKHLPDYEIIEWGNDILNTINNKYVQEATLAKKWAFVSDYIRLYALYHHGGIYLDTDVIVKANLDQFLTHDFFTSYEIYHSTILPMMTAVIGAKSHHEIIKDLLDSYKDSSFIKNGNLDLKPNTARVADYLEKKFNLKKNYNAKETTLLTSNSVIYPYYFFCTPKQGFPNYTIHLFDGSWLPGFTRKDRLKIGRLSITQFKKQTNNNEYEIGLRDKIIFMIKISKNKKLALIWNYK